TEDNPRQGSRDPGGSMPQNAFLAPDPPVMGGGSGARRGCGGGFRRPRRGPVPVFTLQTNGTRPNRQTEQTFARVLVVLAFQGSLLDGPSPALGEGGIQR